MSVLTNIFRICFIISFVKIPASKLVKHQNICIKSDSYSGYFGPRLLTSAQWKPSFIYFNLKFPSKCFVHLTVLCNDEFICKWILWKVFIFQKETRSYNWFLALNTSIVSYNKRVWWKSYRQLRKRVWCTVLIHYRTNSANVFITFAHTRIMSLPKMILNILDPR